ncbi:hypothetical protein OUZ56_032198 [Daphnia magna]|uniref:Uncharacterized protein n=1 Tax=Daphnia magna TaxID=35525 RepID=A0ABQ9ZWI6_9CRUS|nr:hypothetical protein OUZ56_032198 [Daphnia magna]
MKEELCREAEDATKNQYQNPLWNRLRFSRITASVLDQASKCRTVNGSLINLIQGAKLRETSAMSRGKRLESQVLAVLQERYSIHFQQCGLILKPKFPVFGASPDAISEELHIYQTTYKEDCMVS